MGLKNKVVLYKMLYNKRFMELFQNTAIHPKFIIAQAQKYAFSAANYILAAIGEKLTVRELEEAVNENLN